MYSISIQRSLIFAASLIVLSAGFTVAAVSQGFAQLKPPSGDVILVIAGNIGETNVGDEAHFDREMLEALGMGTVKTTTPFDQGEQTFQGPSVSALLKSVKANGDLIVATALDGYAVEIPVRDMLDYPVLLAMTRNGERMGVRNRGPLWIIYPLSLYPELVQEKYSARSIWQLERLEIR